LYSPFCVVRPVTTAVSPWTRTFTSSLVMDSLFWTPDFISATTCALVLTMPFAPVSAFGCLPLVDWFAGHRSQLLSILSKWCEVAHLDLVYLASHDGVHDLPSVAISQVSENDPPPIARVTVQRSWNGLPSPVYLCRPNSRFYHLWRALPRSISSAREVEEVTHLAAPAN
jgi:hypothetical protein